MGTFIALFRGINVGGKTSLPMRDVVVQFERLGLENVKTYIQSGNVVFSGPKKPVPKLADKISTAIAKARGFAPTVVIVSLRRFEQVLDKNPYPAAEAEPKSLHAYFLTEAPKRPNIDALEKARADREEFALERDVLYLHAPDGIGRSKLAAGIEKALGVPATGRNWRTLTKVLEMARSI